MRRFGRGDGGAGAAFSKTSIGSGCSLLDGTRVEEVYLDLRSTGI